MLISENERTPCTRCNGDGNVGIVKYTNRQYKILCPKCLGVTHLDWIQQTRVVERRRDALIICNFLDRYAVPDDYVFLYGGTAYFIKKEFFHLGITYGSSIPRWKNIQMNIPIVKELPQLQEAWSNEKQLWEELSLVI